jgi:hypothetical protein
MLRFWQTTLVTFFEYAAWCPMVVFSVVSTTAPDTSWVGSARIYLYVLDVFAPVLKDQPVRDCPKAPLTTYQTFQTVLTGTIPADDGYKPNVTVTFAGSVRVKPKPVQLVITEMHGCPLPTGDAKQRVTNGSLGRTDPCHYLVKRLWPVELKDHPHQAPKPKVKRVCDRVLHKPLRISHNRVRLIQPPLVGGATMLGKRYKESGQSALQIGEGRGSFH